MRQLIQTCLVAVLLCVIGVPPACGGEPDERKSFGDVPMQTLGGRQFWGDVQFFHGWSIQQNVFTKHYRLLDDEDRSHVSGTLEECRQRLAEIVERDKLQPMSGKAVILVHGIIRSSKSFAQMQKDLREKGFEVFGFDYPSTRISISESARYLAKVIESLEGIDEINFVVHSMGGLVVRSYLAQADPPDERIRRMVMLGVPNQGAEMADKLKQLGLYRLIYGPAGQQLVTDNEALISSLPIPEFEFGIIAGARGTEGGFNPLIPGDDDGTVEVERAKLPGAADFTKVKVLHSFLVRDPEVVDLTQRFLIEGKFHKDRPPHPLPRKDEPSDE